MSFVLSCPNCGATVDVDDTNPFTICKSCGKKSFFNELVPKRIEVTINNANMPTVDKLVLTALNLWLIDDATAINYVNQAMPLAPEDLRVWILKSVIEKTDVSNIIGNARMDPDKDLEFCLKVINKEPSVMKIVKGRMEHPLIQAVADIETALQYIDQRGFVVVTIYDDELTTGYNRVAKEVSELDARIGQDEELIMGSPQLAAYAERMRNKVIVGKIHRLARCLSTPPSSAQHTHLIYVGKLFLGKVIHYDNKGRCSEDRVKKSIVDIAVEAGKHKFIDASFTGTTIALVPAMPDRLITYISVGPNEGSTLIHSYELDDGYYINVNTRRNELPLLIDSHHCAPMTNAGPRFFDRFYRED